MSLSPVSQTIAEGEVVALELSIFRLSALRRGLAPPTILTERMNHI
jgi:hypothetical protein